MSRRVTLRSTAALLAALTLVLGCERGRDAVFETVESAIRPTDGDGWYGNGYGDVPVGSHDSPGGHFRVWFALDGEHAVPGAPAPGAGDDAPAIAALVGDVADEVWALYVDGLGFLAPLPDDVYHDRPDYGGDGRVDIYLQQLRDADGYIVTEACQYPPLFGCGGYFVIDHTFAWYYASDEEAVRVLASHELFHLVQNAYSAGQDGWLTEGTAVYMEEVFWPEQDDYEGFVRRFLEEPERPLDHRRPSDMSDPRPYGAAIFFTFLAERYAPEIVREIWEQTVSADGEERRSLSALEETLTARGVTLADAMLEFALWNGMTGERANPAHGYEGAERYVTTPLASDVALPPDGRLTIAGELPKLAAAYHRVSFPAGSPLYLRVRTEEADPRLRVGLLLERAGGWEPASFAADSDGEPAFDAAGASAAIVVTTDWRMKSNTSEAYTLVLEPAVVTPPAEDIVAPPAEDIVASSEDAVAGGEDAVGAGPEEDTASPKVDAFATGVDAGAGPSDTAEDSGGGGSCSVFSVDSVRPWAVLPTLLLLFLVAIRRRTV